MLEDAQVGRVGLLVFVLLIPVRSNGWARRKARDAALMRESDSRWMSLYVVMVLVGLGERDQAFAALDEAYRERVPFLWQVRFLPEYDALRPDPRYAGLLRRMNL